MKYNNKMRKMLILHSRIVIIQNCTWSQEEDPTGQEGSEVVFTPASCRDPASNPGVVK